MAGGENGPKGEYTPEEYMRPHGNLFERFMYGVFQVYDKPVTYIREKLVEPYQRNRPVYYHRRYRRVPEVDECYTDDQLCLFEANEQYRRDHLVDQAIVDILKRRFEECSLTHRQNYQAICKKEHSDYIAAKENFCIKYADIGKEASVRQAYMKQKHRMVFERRQAEGKHYPTPPEP